MAGRAEIIAGGVAALRTAGLLAGLGTGQGRRQLRRRPAEQGRRQLRCDPVYLWTGMLASDDPARALLLQQFQPMLRQTATSGVPPESVDTRSGKVSGDGPVGFSAALLPLLATAHDTAAAQQQRQRVAALAPLSRKDNYYDQVLTLFGSGWDAARFQFRHDGSLQVAWKCATK